ncbi:MAG TPA: LysR family transcriptional regulator, partial [Acetobacteraceae bacterium]
MIPLPTPQQLRYLLALAEQQHFGRAAEACAVTQSTLSAGILALERQLGAAILDRDGGKRVVFTSLGHELVGRARTAFAALEAMAEAAVAARAPMSGPLRLGIIPTLGPFILPRL